MVDPTPVNIGMGRRTIPRALADAKLMGGMGMLADLATGGGKMPTAGKPKWSILRRANPIWPGRLLIMAMLSIIREVGAGWGGLMGGDVATAEATTEGLLSALVVSFAEAGSGVGGLDDPDWRTDVGDDPRRRLTISKMALCFFSKDRRFRL
jgi:hypothetical protein